MNIKFLFFVLLVFGLVACNDDENPNTFEFNTEEEFKLDQSYNSVRSLLSFTIEEIADSRCPTGVYCIWQGEALISIVIDKPTKDTITLSTHNKSEVSWNNFKFELVEVAPYPDIESEIQEEDYRVIMEISR